MLCRLLLPVAAAIISVLADQRGLPSGAEPRVLTCPNPPTMTEFNLQRYLGKWYEMKRVPRGFERDGICGTAEYSWEDDTQSSVNVVNRNYLPSTTEFYSANLRAAPKNATEASQGRFIVSFPSQPSVPDANYWVLDTNYDTYAVVYSCSPSAPSVTLWVLARDPAKFTAALEQKIDAMLEERGLFPSMLQPVEQQSCPVTVCAPCSKTQDNLSVKRLSGARWWEVQHSTYAYHAGDLTCGFVEFKETADGINLSSTAFQNSVEKDATFHVEAKRKDSSVKNGYFTTRSEGGQPGYLCVIEVDNDYSSYLVMSLCKERGADKAVEGGVYVLSRRRGLTDEDQLKANKALVSVGTAPATMHGTDSTPCPAAALSGGPRSLSPPLGPLGLAVALTAVLTHQLPYRIAL